MDEIQSIITKLTEGTCVEGAQGAKKKAPKKAQGAKKDEKDECTEEEVDYTGYYAYMCPECGESFLSKDPIDGNCECPYCGETIVPESEGVIGEDSEIADEEPEETEDIDNEAFIKISKGKVIKRSKAPKKGFKVVNGKYVKMTAKELRARRKSAKKANRKSHTGKANLARAKSMRKRSRLAASTSIDLESFIDVFNDALANYYEGEVDESYCVPTITGITEATRSGDDLVVNCSIEYDNGLKESADVVITSDGYVDFGDLVDESYEATIKFAKDTDSLVAESIEEQL